MGKMEVMERSSLDRLRGLAHLKDPEQQLAEALQLCNHSARAEMITRWLLESTSKSAAFRTSPNTWRLFISCVRILPKRRAAALLGQHGFIAVLANTCAEPTQSEASMSAMASFLKLILILGDTPDGAALKSLLIIRDEKAAAICGNWFRHVHDIIPQIGVQALIDEDLLGPAVCLWNLRTRLESDRELFLKHCLGPVLLLLVSLRQNLGSEAIKRKRDATAASSVSACIRSLEVLVTTHFVLPVRQAFTKTLTSRQAVARDYDPEQAELRSDFEPVSNAMSSGPAEKWAQAPPILMDIALRSIAMPTPRHRQNERPWFEAFFTALHGCFHSLATENVMLGKVLEVLYRKQISLSPWMLKALVKQYALSEQRPGTPDDFSLVATICALDAHPLTELDITTAIFDAISNAANADGNDVKTLPVNYRDSVIVPLIGAFSKSRSLVSFFGAWHSQLRSTLDSQASSIWSSIIPDVAAVLEQSLSHEQISELIEQYRTSLVKPNFAGEGTEVDMNEIFCSLVHLNALLSSVRNEDLVRTTSVAAESLLELLLCWPYDPLISRSARLRLEYIDLLNIVFQAQFHSWAAQQNANTAFESLADRILESSAFTTLNRSDSKSSKKHEASDSELNGRSESIVRGMCLATLLDAFAPYKASKKCATLCDWALKNIDVKQSFSVRILAQHPAVLEAVKPGKRQKLVRMLLNNATTSESKARPAYECSVEAIVDILLSHSDVTELEATVKILIDFLNESSTDRDNSQCETVALSILDSVPMQVLAEDIRRNLVDVLTTLPCLQYTTNGNSLFEQRLAFLTKVVQAGCDGAQLLVDEKCFWQTIDPTSSKIHHGEGAHPHPNFATMSVLDQISNLTRAVFSFWARQQAGETGRDMLSKQSRVIRDSIRGEDFDSASGLEMNVRRMEAVGMAIEMLEKGARIHPSITLPHRDLDVVTPILSSVTTQISTDSSNNATHGSDSLPSNKAIVAFNAAATVLRSTVRHIPEEGRKQILATLTIAETSLQQACRALEGGMVQDAETEGCRQRWLSICYDVVCQYAADDAHAFTTTSLELLQQNLDARIHASILSSFAAKLEKQSTDWRESVALKLLGDSSYDPHAVLLLQGVVASRMTRADAEADDHRVAPQLVESAVKSVSQNKDNAPCVNTALRTMAMLLKDKPFLITQHSLEQILSALHQVSSSRAIIAYSYLDICRVMTTLLAHHRSRLQGRFHLMVVLFQNLLSCIEVEQGEAAKDLTVRQAQALGRLLALFCDPPLVRHRSKSSGLVDEARREKAHVGQYVPYVLHHYCGQVLATSMRQEVREALTPGVWSMIEAIEVNSNEGIRVLSAAMNNSERSVLRSVYEDWKRSGKWEGV